MNSPLIFGEMAGENATRDLETFATHLSGGWQFLGSFFSFAKPENIQLRYDLQRDRYSAQSRKRLAKFQGHFSVDMTPLPEILEKGYLEYATLMRRWRNIRLGEKVNAHFHDAVEEFDNDVDTIECLRSGTEVLSVRTQGGVLVGYMVVINAKDHELAYAHEIVYEPELQKKWSIGKNMVRAYAEAHLQQGGAYLYPGYWCPEKTSRTFYKAALFNGCDLFLDGDWCHIETARMRENPDQFVRLQTNHSFPSPGKSA